MKKPVKKLAFTNTSESRWGGGGREGVSFPVPRGRTELPKSYTVVLGEIKERIRTERLRVVMAANAAMLFLYWGIGRTG
jgi:hypothetical protein